MNVSEQVLLYLCDALKRYPAIDFSLPYDQLYVDHDLIMNLEYQNLAEAITDAKFLHERGFNIRIQPLEGVFKKNCYPLDAEDLLLYPKGKWNLQARIYSVLDLRLIVNTFQSDAKMINELITDCYRKRYLRDKGYPFHSEYSATLNYRNDCWHQLFLSGLNECEGEYSDEDIMPGGELQIESSSEN